MPRVVVSHTIVAAVALASVGAAFHWQPAGGRTQRPSLAARASWVITGWNIHRIDRVDPALARALFDAPTTYSLGGAVGNPLQVPSGFRSTPTLIYRSLQRFRSDIAARAVPPQARVVMYDPERWPDTPVAEQRRPVSAMREFSAIARRHRYRVVLAPARDLMLVRGAPCHREGREDLDDAYLRCGIAKAARWADVFSIQSQADEFSRSQFTRLVRESSAQARRANPAVRVLAGFSTAPTGRPASAAQIARALAWAHPYVQGFWANIFASAASQLEAAKTALSAFRSRY